MRHKPVAAALVVAGTVGSSWLTGVATAAPDNAEPALVIQVDCGDGAFDVVVNGRGRWVPAHREGTNTVFIPIAFGTFNGTFTPSDGGAPVTFSAPPSEKAHDEAPGDRELVNCTYSLVDELPDGTVTGTGTVTGWNPNAD